MRRNEKAYVRRGMLKRERGKKQQNNISEREEKAKCQHALEYCSSSLVAYSTEYITA